MHTCVPTYICDSQKNEFSWTRKVSYTRIVTSRQYEPMIRKTRPRISDSLSEKRLTRVFDKGIRTYRHAVLHPRDWHISTVATLSVVVVVVTGKMRSGSVPKPSCPLIVRSTRGVLRQVSPIFLQCPESYIPSGGPILSLSLFSLSLYLSVRHCVHPPLVRTLLSEAGGNVARGTGARNESNKPATRAHLLHNTRNETPRGPDGS